MEQNESHALILIDEDDNEIEFDMLDKFDFEGSTFLVILRDAGEGALAGIDDEDQLDRVFAEYKKRNDIED